jgi:hypothetical protein
MDMKKENKREECGVYQSHWQPHIKNWVSFVTGFISALGARPRAMDLHFFGLF